jgi:acyl carrier protein
MMIDKDGMEQQIRVILATITKREIVAELDTPLYAEGIELDSLEIAELSAVLEAEFSSDPFLEDQVPQTIGDIIEFYRGQSIAQPSS